MECTNIVDPHQLLCHWFTLIFVLICIYTSDYLFPRQIVNEHGGRPLIFYYAARDWSRQISGKELTNRVPCNR